MKSTRMTLLVFTLPALLLFTGCDAEQEIVPPRVTRVEAARLETRTFQQRLRVQGTVKPVEEAEISSRIAGTIDELLVSEGDQVDKGQMLFRVDRKNLENEVAVAEQDLEVARSNVETALADLNISKIKQEKTELDFKRAERLQQANAISEDAHEIAAMNHKTAVAAVTKNEAILHYSQAKVAQQEIQLEIARKNLADSQGIAPFGGTITRKYKDQEEYVSGGTPMLHLENPSKLEISCLISAVYYNAVIVDQTQGRVLFDGYELAAVPLSYRASSIDPLSRTFEIKLTLPADTPLVSGTLCDIDLILEEREGVGLPADAVMLRKGGEHLCYLVRDGKAESVDIKPGITSDGYTEILNPDQLKEELFIVSGQYFLNPGDAVAILDTGKAGPTE